MILKRNEHRFNSPARVQQYTVTVCDFRAHPMEEVVPYSKSSLIFLDGILDEDEKYDYAESRTVCFLNILYENNSLWPFDCFPDQWKIIDSEGYSHKRTLLDESIMEQLDFPVLHDSPLNPGRKLRAWIPFVIKKGRTPQFVSFTTLGKSIEIIIPQEYSVLLPMDGTGN